MTWERQRRERTITRESQRLLRLHLESSRVISGITGKVVGEVLLVLRFEGETLRPEQTLNLGIVMKKKWGQPYPP